MSLTVLYIPARILTLLREETRFNMLLEEGITMNTLYLELYEAIMFKNGKFKRPNECYDILSYIKTKDITHSLSKKYNVTIYTLDIDGISKETKFMKLDRGTLTSNDKRLIYFKSILGASNFVS